MTRGPALACAAAALLQPAAARAERPTEGGLWSFSPEDVIATYDRADHDLRIHYSVAGPNAAPLADVDDDGVPDYVALVAAIAAESLDRFAALGLRAPLREADLDLDPLGGSGALDLYLVDFAGAADGHFAIDGCTAAPSRCGGYMVVENDFAGYSYASAAEGLDTVVAHELFHAVQAAYTPALPVWASEGTAVWAERALRPDSRDFLRFCDAYLADTGRSLDRPPAGPVPSFAYGTALWWDFVVDRAGPGLLDALFAGVRGDDDPALLPALEGVLKDRGYDLEAAWIDFVSANLATGARASVDRGYDYAGELAGVAAEAEGAVIDDDDRHFPLAARYYRLDHPGGALQLGLEAPAPGLHLAVFAVDDGAADGPVGPAIARWEGSTAGPVDLGERPPGGYWILATNPRSDGEVVRARLCAGLVDGALPCVDEAAEDSSSEPDADADTSADADADAQPTDDALGCSCRGAAPPRDRRALASLVALALLALRRRRGRAADLDEDR